MIIRISPDRKILRVVAENEAERQRLLSADLWPYEPIRFGQYDMLLLGLATIGHRELKLGDDPSLTEGQPYLQSIDGEERWAFIGNYISMRHALANEGLALFKQVLTPDPNKLNLDYPEAPETDAEWPVMVVPRASSLHISQQEFSALLEHGGTGVIVTRIADCTGVILYWPNEELALAEFFEGTGFNNELRRLILAFNALGYTYLRLDTEAPVLRLTNGDNLAFPS